MTRTIRLNQLSEYFPTCQISPIITDTYNTPIHLGNDLQNRLVTFALGLGAVSARFDLSGTARDWHLALNEYADRYEENESAGLYRFLHIRRQTAEVKTPARSIRTDTRCFDHLQRMAA